MRDLRKELVPQFSNIQPNQHKQHDLPQEGDIIETGGKRYRVLKTKTTQVKREKTFIEMAGPMWAGSDD